MGSLSSWYIFSSISFYPVAPCSSTYIIGSPMFKEATIDLGNKKTFSVRTQNNSKQNIYIQSATLNDKPFTRTWITHNEVTKGGILTFVMGPEPNKNWGSRPEDAIPIDPPTAILLK